MKERIVIEADEKICKGCDICLQEPRIVAICNLKNNLDIDLKKERVPENFSELKELCKSIKGNKKDCGGAMWFEFGCLNNDKMYLGKFLCVDEKGQVGIAERSWGGDISITILAQNRTSQQMWQIIKNLIGEE